MVVADQPFDLLPRIARLICHAVDGVDDCGITVRHGGQAMTLAFSSDLAALNDELQYTANAGPCLQALEDGSSVESEDLGAEARWDRYPAAAVSCGARSVLSLPIYAAGAGHGVLNLYSRVVRGFSDDDRLACVEFAGVIADVIAATAHVGAGSGSAMAERLQEALVRRGNVAQAIGVFMARHNCGAQEAFQLLLLSSREHGEDIYTAAARIRTTTGPRDD